MRRNQDTTDSSESCVSGRQHAPSEVSECQSFYQNAAIDNKKTTAITATPRVLKPIEVFNSPTVQPSGHLGKEESIHMYESMVPVPDRRSADPHKEESVLRYESTVTVPEKLQQEESVLMYESMVPVPEKHNGDLQKEESIQIHELKARDPTTSTKSVRSEEDKFPQSSSLKIHPNGRYEDEADCFYQQPSPARKSPVRRSHHCQDHIHTDTTSESVSESLSDGEVKCRCNASLGEMHFCRYARNIKDRVQHLKRHPRRLLRYELAESGLEVADQKKHYLNWVTYYVKKPEAT